MDIEKIIYKNNTLEYLLSSEFTLPRYYSA